MDTLSTEISKLKNKIEGEKYHENKIKAETSELENKTKTIEHFTEKLQK